MLHKGQIQQYTKLLIKKQSLLSTRRELKSNENARRDRTLDEVPYSDTLRRFLDL